MVQYNQDWHAAQLLPPVCPKCGSHRTQVVGRSDDGKTVIVRCNACGEQSRVVVPDNGPQSISDSDAIEQVEQVIEDWGR